MPSRRTSPLSLLPDGPRPKLVAAGKIPPHAAIPADDFDLAPLAGLPPRAAASVYTGFKMPPAMAEDLRRLAAENNVGVSTLIRHFLTQGLDRARKSTPSGATITV